MPLLDDRLTIWQIGFRWTGRNPDLPWLWIPMEVKDNFRVVVRAIDEGDLHCSSLKSEPGTYELPKSLVQRNAKVMDECIEGERYDRKFLKRHSVRRWDFAHWCDDKCIPFPEFWFPPGWENTAPFDLPSLRKTTRSSRPASENPKAAPDTREAARSARTNDTIWLDVRAAAKAIWAESGPIPSAEVARRIHAMKGIGGSHFTVDVIRKRIAKLAPAEIRGKPGRPPKKDSA